MKTIKESDKAVILGINEGNFEIWLKRFWTVGPKKGELIHPSDEDFGVSAWTVYSEERAIQIFNEINEGIRDIRPMLEEG